MLSSALVDLPSCELFIEPTRLHSDKNNDLQVGIKIGRTQFNRNFGKTDATIYGLLLYRFNSNTAMHLFSSLLEIAEHNGWQ